MPSVIGLVGRKGAGKDTAGKILTDHFGFKRVAFADCLKQVCSIVFDLTDEEMNNPALKEQFIDRWPYQSPREIMQKVGTECFRTYWPDVWIEAAKRKIDAYMLNGESVVVTDVRFENELLAVRARGGVNIRIDATERLGPPADGHASEALGELLPVQYVISNNKDLESFQASFNEAARRILHG